MADEWIKLRSCLFSGHPTIVRLAELLDMEDPDFVVGKLARLWVHADQHTTDGVLKHATAETIDRIVGYPGFAAALEAVGWGRGGDGFYQIERFDEHNTQSTKKRLQTARRADRHRNGPTESRDGVTKVTRQRDVKRTRALRKAHLEGEGEGETEEEYPPYPPKGGRGSGETPDPPPGPSVGPDADRSADANVAKLWGDSAIQFDPATGTWHGITDRNRSVWKEAYPAVDVPRELAVAASWCLANRQKGKKSNYLAFLDNWFKRCQDRGGSSPRDIGRKSDTDHRPVDPTRDYARMRNHNLPAAALPAGERAPDSTPAEGDPF